MGTRAKGHKGGGAQGQMGTRAMDRRENRHPIKGAQEKRGSRAKRRNGNEAKGQRCKEAYGQRGTQAIGRKGNGNKGT